MTRFIRIDPAIAMAEGLDAIRAEAGVVVEFPPEVEREAEQAASRVAEYQRADFELVTIDPPGSKDLDQAVQIERVGEGHRVRYAIADVGFFVDPGSALDAEAHARAVTVYAPDRKAPLHPEALSEGAASLLPGAWRPAVLWTLDLDATGELVDAGVTRSLVRSVAQHTYEDVPDPLLALLEEVGERRMAIEERRGGVRLAVPEQEVEQLPDGTWTVEYRAPLETEDWNAQVSLLTGTAAARLMLSAGIGILRTQEAPDEKSLARLRRQAAGLHVDWPEGMGYPELIRTLDPSLPTHAALLHEATGVGGGARYTPFDGSPPEASRHFSIAAEYAHATAPLRRLQDRYVSECCLAAAAGRPVPGWVRAGLQELPEAMAAGDRRANAVERGVVDLVEALLLVGREGETFEAVVIDEGRLQLRDPAVRARMEGTPDPGTELTVRLERTDPAARLVEFAPS